MNYLQRLLDELMAGNMGGTPQRSRYGDLLRSQQRTGLFGGGASTTPTSLPTTTGSNGGAGGGGETPTTPPSTGGPSAGVDTSGWVLIDGVLYPPGTKPGDPITLIKPRG